MTPRLESALQYWSYIAPLLRPAEDATQYGELVEALDAVLDAGGADESHPLARLAGYLGDLIEEYESRDEMPPEASGAEVLRFLMGRDQLRQSDLPELGSQGVVSELLAGRRNFNVRQAKVAADRFGVPVAMFL